MVPIGRSRCESRSVRRRRGYPTSAQYATCGLDREATENFESVRLGHRGIRDSPEERGRCEIGGDQHDAVGQGDGSQLMQGRQILDGAHPSANWAKRASVPREPNHKSRRRPPRPPRRASWHTELRWREMEEVFRRSTAALLVRSSRWVRQPVNSASRSYFWRYAAAAGLRTNPERRQPREAVRARSRRVRT